MSDLEDAVNQMIEMGRDAQRPLIGDVVAVLERAFADLEIRVRCDVRGPDCWVWADESFEASGQPKYYVVGQSTMPGTEGYPLLTIRQAFFPRLDTWVTTSQLVIGPDEDRISHGIALAIANHAGAMAGMRWSIAAAAKADGDATAAIGAVRSLMDAANSVLNAQAQSHSTVDPREVN